MKLTVTKTQEDALYLLRLEGLRRKIELEEATAEFKRAAQIEKEVAQYVVENNEYIANRPDDEEMHGKRITDEFFMCYADVAAFESDYLPKIKTAFMDLHGIDNPLNFVYSAPMRDRMHKAERSYQMIAAEFLKICGRPAEAEQIEKSIKTYLRKDLLDRLYKMNDDFIGGKEATK